MSNFPKVGLEFEYARRRAVRIAKNPKVEKKHQEQLVNSLCNQIKLNDGEDAVKEVHKEILTDTNNHTSNKLGWSPHYADRYEKIFGKKK